MFKKTNCQGPVENSSKILMNTIKQTIGDYLQLFKEEIYLETKNLKSVFLHRMSYSKVDKQVKVSCFHRLQGSGKLMQSSRVY